MTQTLTMSESYCKGNFTVSHTAAGLVTVTVNLWRSDGGRSYNNNASSNFTVTIDGTEYKETVTEVKGTKGTSFSKQKNVTLSATGTASITVKVTGSIPGTSFGISGNTTMEYNITDGNKKTYTISFNANGGVGAPASQIKTHGVDLYLASAKPLKNAYEFQHWSVPSRGADVTYKPGQLVQYDGNQELVAYWRKWIGLTFDANGGSNPPGVIVVTVDNDVTGYRFTIPSGTPTRVGYDFLGWSPDSSATTAKYKAGDTLSLEESVTLYAVWKIKTYKISYNANGGSGTPSEQTKTYAVNIKLSTTIPTRAGYKFLGWSTSSSATTATYASGATFSSNANTTLYAVWERLGIAKVKTNGTFKNGQVFVKDNNTWRNGVIFVNYNGTWRQGGI